MGYRISTPINVMLSEAKEFKMNIRFNLIVSKFVYKAMANKFSLAYEALEELEIIAIRRNLKVEAIQGSRLFKHYMTSRHERRIIHRSAYPPAFWHPYEIYNQEITYGACLDTSVLRTLRTCLAANKREITVLSLQIPHINLSHIHKTLLLSTLMAQRIRRVLLGPASSLLGWPIVSATGSHRRRQSFLRSFGLCIRLFSLLMILDGSVISSSRTQRVL